MSKKPKPAKLKFLSGSDLAPYIKSRQQKRIRSLNQASKINPHLAIVSANPGNKAIQTYIKYKKIYADQIGVQCSIFELDQSELEPKLAQLVKDPKVHGIILQLPLQDPAPTEDLLSLIPPQKDVDGLGPESKMQPATAKAILWLLAAYNIEPSKLNTLIIGKGKLVGEPLFKLLASSTPAEQLKVLDATNTKAELQQALDWADVVITATGSTGLLKLSNLHADQVIIDAGTSESNGRLTGDLDPKVYQDPPTLSLKLTPTIGGVGPLTIACLFENLLDSIDSR
jgi:methylenetetrahydrofolate dehydrogenase (NADP+)/methenyltetrahydrofolate cyclohydrolase